MSDVKISHGAVHKLPDDLKQSLLANPKVLTSWESLTPLARNEFICWVEDAKQDATRLRRIRRTSEELLEGQRRPCCWLGCIHRTDKPISPSIQGILASRQGKSNS